MAYTPEELDKAMHKVHELAEDAEELQEAHEQSKEGDDTMGDMALSDVLTELQKEATGADAEHFTQFMHTSTAGN